MSTKPTIVDADLSQSFGYANVHFFNPFTGETEKYTTSNAAINSMLHAASQKIDALQEEIRRIKAFLVID